MINEIKAIVKNYIRSMKLCDIITGTVEADGIRINDCIVIPNEIIIGNLKNTIVTNNKVLLLQKQGGTQYYILEVIT
jgi:hypothetical protein